VHRLAWLSFVLCIAVAATYIVVTTGALPERVASHFDARNAANGFMTRDGYQIFMLGFAIVLPAFLAAGIGLLPRALPNAINIPHREYWLDPKRKQETLDALSAHGAWLGSLVALFIAAMHHVLLIANRASPQHLPAGLFTMVLVGFVAAIVLWAASLWLRFRNAP
jgi:hypothetical protein